MTAAEAAALVRPDDSVGVPLGPGQPVTLLHALEANGLRRGLASLCLGGGNAVAVIVERV